MQTQDDVFIEAIKHKNIKTLTDLIDQGADLNKSLGDEGTVPLQEALKTGSLNVVKLFIEKGADRNCTTRTGQNLLHLCAFNDFPNEVASYLFEKGVDPNFRDIYGWTPLHVAIYQNKLSYIELLLDKGSNPYIPTTKDETAFDMAEEIKNTGIITVLESFRDKYKKVDPSDLSLYEESTEDQDQSTVIESGGAAEDEYLINRDISNDQDTIKKLRTTITQWADTIPHHGIRKMGEQIDIKKVYYRPAYTMALSTLYDNRTVSEHYVPYTGQELPQRKFHSVSDVDVWDFTLRHPENYSNAFDRYTVTGSQYVTECHTCHGHGNITCPSCSGQGETVCSSCNGNGSETCYSCNGSGDRACPSCGGTGNRQEQYYKTFVDSKGVYSHQSAVRTVTCSCSGGRVRCNSCNGSGSKTCSRCGGRGHVVCSHCGGSGSITCPTCEGHKKLYNYYTLNQTVKPRFLNHCFLEKNVMEEYPLFTINPSNHKGLSKIQDEKENLDQGLFDATPFKNTYNKYLEKARSSTPFDGKKGSTRSIRQKVNLKRHEVYDVHYSFKGKDYILLVWGYEDEVQVYAQVSHFSELRDTFLEKAQKSYKWRRWGMCFNNLDKADDLDVHNEQEEIYTMKAAVEKKMYRQYRFGLFIGSILPALGLGWYSLQYFREDHFIGSWFKDLFYKNWKLQLSHSIVMTVFFGLAVLTNQGKMFKFMKTYYNNKIRHEWVRWTFPVLIGIITTAVTWLACCVINSSGLGLLLTQFVIGVIHTVGAVIIPVVNGIKYLGGLS